MNVEFKINALDQASEPLRQKVEAMDPRRLAPIVGPELEKLTRLHVKALGKNKHEWPSTHFWEDAAKKSAWKATDDGSIEITVAHLGIRQRYYGGQILPKNVKALTIPVNSAAYGKTAKDFPNLMLIPTRKGVYLAQSNMEEVGHTLQGKISRRGQQHRMKRQILTFMFKLVPSVDQPANPNVLPTSEEYGRTTLAALDKAVTKIVRGGQP